MRASLAVCILFTLVLASAPASALLGQDTLTIPEPRAGDAGVYEVRTLAVDEGSTELAEANLSFGFELGHPASIPDAYGQDRRAFPLDTVLLAGGDPALAWRRWLDHRGLGPLRTEFSGTSSETTPQAPIPTDWNTSSATRWQDFARAGKPPIRTEACGLFTDLQGQRLEEGSRPPLEQVCGQSLKAYSGGDETITIDVEQVQALEGDLTSAMVRMEARSANATMTVEHWYRSDLSYPTQINVFADLPSGEATGEAWRLPSSLRTATHWSAILDRIPWDELTTDLDGDGRANVVATAILDRFRQGDGPVLSEGARSPWATHHRLVETGPTDAWGPQQGGSTFTYTLDDAVEALTEDPSLDAFHAWLEDTPGHQLALATLTTLEDIHGRERQRWDLLVLGPDGDGWALHSERPTGVDIDDRRIDQEIPVSENEATYNETTGIPYPGPPGDEVITIASAIDVWRSQVGDGDEGDPRSFTWWDTGSSAIMSVGHTDFDTYTLDPSAPSPMATQVRSSHVQLHPSTGAVDRVTDFSGSWGVEPADTDGAQDTGWQPGAGVEATDAALSAPLVATLAGAGGIAVLLLLLAKLGLLPFYSRLADDELLDNEARRRAYETITEQPGRSLSEVAQAADLARSTARYHLRRLEQGGLVRSVKGPDARRFFTAGGSSPEEQAREAVLAAGRTREVYEAIEADPGASLTRISDAVGVAPSSAHRIVERLLDAGLVEKHRDGRSVTLEPTQDTPSA